VDDLRWFAPNRYCALPVPQLRLGGLRIALDGDAAAGIAVAADGQCAVEAWGFARRHRCPLLLYLWDLPPWRLGNGRPDWIEAFGSRLVRVPRPVGGFPERAGYYSRIRYVARTAAAVWCPSAHTTGEVTRRFGVPAREVPFCYDSDRFGRPATDPPAPPPGGPTLLSISRLVPHKNHQVLIRAAGSIATRPVVRILGEGPEAQGLRRLADQLGVGLDLPGRWASEEEILSAYRGASAVIAPSRFEGFGLTPLEGLAMGRPVIASDIPPHREFVGTAARFFPADDHLALAAAITAALAAPPLSPAARLDALATLTIEACAVRMLPELARLLGKAP
jgi:glycosyltransferase involved in cell wall biosynthesis